jgi:citrate synthase
MQINIWPKPKTKMILSVGFGHRVYKNFDPRKNYKKAADEVLSTLGVDDPILLLQKKKKHLVDEYFVSRKLYPNVDFYSGIIYRALGIPTDMFTVMFAIGRLPGWIAQWKEMRENKEPIGRPRQIYTGHPLRDLKHPIKDKFTLKASLFCEVFYICQKLKHMLEVKYT